MARLATMNVPAANGDIRPMGTCPKVAELRESQRRGRNRCPSDAARGSANPTSMTKRYRRTGQPPGARVRALPIADEGAPRQAGGRPGPLVGDMGIKSA